jgi:rRNA-processing protein FCF1
MSDLYSQTCITLQQFESLHKAVIDTSSIIYLQAIDLFSTLNRTINLCTPQSVIDEYNKPLENITIVTDLPRIPTDDQILQLATMKRLPVITEDFKIIKSFSQTGLPFFNSLMMTSFLFFRKIITYDTYYHHIHQLKQFARYNDYVWSYGEQVVAEIIKGHH